jgi:hypothetical protein
VFKGCLAIKILLIDLYWQVGFGGWCQRISQPALNLKKKTFEEGVIPNGIGLIVFSFHPCVWGLGINSF